MKVKRSVFKEILLDAVAVAAGAAVYAVSVDMFLQPLGVAVGGVTGIATILNRLFATPIGIVIIAINVPLVLLAWRVLGFKFILKSAVGLVASSIAIDLLPQIDLSGGDMLLGCFIGGALMGAAIGLLFVRGYSTGGSDFVLWMLKKKFPHLSTGAIYFAVDAVVIIFGAIAYKDMKMLLYSSLTVFVSQKAVDLIMTMGERSEMVYIISDEYEKIAECISTVFDRGVTILNGTGYYSGADKKILMCAMSKRQFYPLLSKIKSIDRHAFIVSGAASRVIGEGFGSIEE